MEISEKSNADIVRIRQLEEQLNKEQKERKEEKRQRESLFQEKS